MNFLSFIFSNFPVVEHHKKIVHPLGNIRPALPWSWSGRAAQHSLLLSALSQSENKISTPGQDQISCSSTVYVGHQEDWSPGLRDGWALPTPDLVLSTKAVAELWGSAWLIDSWWRMGWELLQPHRQLSASYLLLVVTGGSQLFKNGLLRTPNSS